MTNEKQVLRFAQDDKRTVQVLHFAQDDNKSSRTAATHLRERST
jgi:hypothetical protein